MDLKDIYKSEAVPRMKEQFGYTNNLAVPRITKVVINIGVGNYLHDDDMRKRIAEDLAFITSQKAVPTIARRAVAAFKVRENMVLGFKVTLRGKRMYDFLTRLIHVVLPRIRDFRGLSPKAIDEGGSLTIGIREHMVFPEIKEENLRNIFGLEATVVTNASSRKEAEELFRLLGFPLKQDG